MERIISRSPQLSTDPALQLTVYAWCLLADKIAHEHPLRVSSARYTRMPRKWEQVWTGLQKHPMSTLSKMPGLLADKRPALKQCCTTFWLELGTSTGRHWSLPWSQSSLRTADPRREKTTSSNNVLANVRPLPLHNAWRTYKRRSVQRKWPYWEAWCSRLAPTSLAIKTAMMGCYGRPLPCK